MNFFDILRGKCANKYIPEQIFIDFKADIRARSQTLYAHELKVCHNVSKRIIIGMIAERVSKELALIAHKRDISGYNKICHHYNLPKINHRDEDRAKQLQQEIMTANGMYNDIQSMIDKGNKELDSLPPAYGINKL
ncbi:TPA: hypothetical protein ACGUON_000720 [Vibrio vulnificus]|nr:hypothetical protein [Vibrio vulnificus]